MSEMPIGQPSPEAVSSPGEAATTLRAGVGETLKVVETDPITLGDGCLSAYGTVDVPRLVSRLTEAMEASGNETGKHIDKFLLHKTGCSLVGIIRLLWDGNGHRPIRIPLNVRLENGLDLATNEYFMAGLTETTKDRLQDAKVSIEEKDGVAVAILLSLKKLRLPISRIFMSKYKRTKIEEKLREYWTRLSSLQLELAEWGAPESISERLASTTYKIAIAEELLANDEVDTELLAERFSAEPGGIHLDKFNKACQVLSDYCRADDNVVGRF